MIARSYAPEVVADSSGWTGNSLRFASKGEAEGWVLDLSRRWMLVRDTRVVESDDKPNARFVGGELEMIK
jgi:hypothetical protein